MAEGLRVRMDESIDSSPWIKYAIEQIRTDYGDHVSVAEKGKSLLKFGKNDDVGTSTETVWNRGGTETLIASNAISHLSSDDAGDDQDVIIEGHTLSGTDFTFVVQSATLNGQSKVALTTPLARTSRIYNNDSTDFAGTVYVYEDDTVTAGVPQTSAKIHLQTEGSNNQSLKGATTVSSKDYWLIHDLYAVVNKKTAATVDFNFQTKFSGKTFRTRIPCSAHSQGYSFQVILEPYLIVPKNADFRITAAASTTGVSVEAWANGPLAIIKGV